MSRGGQRAGAGRPREDAARLKPRGKQLTMEADGELLAAVEAHRDALLLPTTAAALRHLVALGAMRARAASPATVPLPDLLAALGLPAGTGVEEALGLAAKLAPPDYFGQSMLDPKFRDVYVEEAELAAERRTLATVHEIVIRHSHSPDDSTDSLVAIEEDLAERFPSSWPSWPGEPEGGG